MEWQAFNVLDRTRAAEEEWRLIPAFDNMTVLDFKQAFQEVTGVSAAQLRVCGQTALQRGCSFEPPTAQMADFNTIDVVVMKKEGADQPETWRPPRPSCWEADQLGTLQPSRPSRWEADRPGTPQPLRPSRVEADQPGTRLPPQSSCWEAVRERCNVM